MRLFDFQDISFILWVCISLCLCLHTVKFDSQRQTAHIRKVIVLVTNLRDFFHKNLTTDIQKVFTAEIIWDNQFSNAKCSENGWLKTCRTDACVRYYQVLKFVMLQEKSPSKKSRSRSFFGPNAAKYTFHVVNTLTFWNYMYWLVNIFNFWKCMYRFLIIFSISYERCYFQYSANWKNLLSTFRSRIIRESYSSQIICD